MSGDIPFAGTFIPGGAGFGIIYASDQVGGWASAADETAIGAIAVGRLVVGGTWRTALGSGITYLLTSLTPAGGFANGTWLAIPGLSLLLGADQFGGLGPSLLLTQVSQVTTGSDPLALARSEVRSGTTMTDATTWAEQSTINAAILPVNTGHVFTYLINATDFSLGGGTKASGDIAKVVLEFTATVDADTGTITIASGTTNTSGTLTLAQTNVLATIGGVTGSTSPLAGARARVSGATIVLETQGAAGKKYETVVTAQALDRKR